ncbi:hypothetical protein [Nocardia sp. NPDC049149]|uniref:hypothetical protein n=1 Tax=Nocardia sp. NPDC049149 TaxID=3364315 RepID=UPI0037221221
MEHPRTKIAGPAIAAGAVSLGLVLIGACGIGRNDTHVDPPPLQSDPYIAPAAAREGVTTTAAVLIPPSPTWQIAPYQAPHATPFTGFATTTSGEPTPSGESTAPAPHEDPAPSDSETTTRPTRPATTARPTTPRTTTEPSTSEPAVTTRPAPPSGEHD